MFRDEADVQQAMDVFMPNALRSGQGLPQTPLATLGQTLAWLLPGSFMRAVIRYAILSDWNFYMALQSGS